MALQLVYGVLGIKPKASFVPVKYPSHGPRAYVYFLRQSCSIAQAGLELITLLPQFPKCCDDRLAELKATCLGKHSSLSHIPSSPQNTRPTSSPDHTVSIHHEPL